MAMLESGASDHTAVLVTHGCHLAIVALGCRSLADGASFRLIEATALRDYTQQHLVRGSELQSLFVRRRFLVRLCEHLHADCKLAMQGIRNGDKYLIRVALQACAVPSGGTQFLDPATWNVREIVEKVGPWGAGVALSLASLFIQAQDRAVSRAK